MSVAKALCVVYISHDDGKTWALIRPEEVPAWITADADVMANLINGEMAQRGGVVNAQGVAPWYRAERIEPAEGETVQ